MTEAAKSPIRVLYVLGAGRSGSTLLDIVLGNHPEIESAGEFGYYLRPTTAADLARGGWDNAQYCGCGRRVNDCPFWSLVRQRWSERTGMDDVVRRYSALQQACEGYARLPFLLWKKRKPPLLRAYIELTSELFETIREVSGRSIIVDSTKNLPRAIAISEAPGIDLYVVHLIRDVRGVAHSRNKMLKKDERGGVAGDLAGWSIRRSAANWLAKNLLCELWLRRLGPGRSVRLFYEGFIDDPKDALDKIGRLIGPDLTEQAKAVSAGQPLQVSHNIGGNRLRMSKNLTLRPDAGRWRNTMPAEDQRLSWTIAGWLMRRYGYKK